MNQDDNGTHKNITVTASDEDAEVLAQLLRSAGLGGGMSQGHQETCPSCGATGCGCDENMAEAYGDTDATQNEPDWPTNTEYTSMKQSTDPVGNDLNRNKTDVAGDGQTTIPVTAVHTQDEDALRRMMEMAGISNLKSLSTSALKAAASKDADADKKSGVSPQYSTQQIKDELARRNKESVDEGFVDAVKKGVKAVDKFVTGGDKEDLIKQVQKDAGVEQTGKKPEPKDDNKMQESLMKEFENFRI
jgi:hypothetical protein